MSEALVIGSVALDDVETPHGTVKSALGGSAAYGSVAASYFVPTSLVAVIGQDFPQDYRTQIESRGINTDALQVQEGNTFHWSGYYERTMAVAHTNTTELNVFEHFRPDLTEAQKDARFVFLANIHPELQLHVLRQLRKPELVALDTMNLWIEATKKELTEAIRNVTMLLMNEEEARQYCETTNLAEAGQQLLSMGPQTVVIKKGEHGAIVFQKDAHLAIPAFPVLNLKDPTGAGDTFAGSMVGYAARLNSATPENMRRAVVIGSIMASFVVEDFSLNRTLSLTAAEIEQRIDHLLSMMTVPELDRETFKPCNGAISA